MKLTLLIAILLVGLAATGAIFAQDNGPMLPAAGDTAFTGVATVELYPNTNEEENQVWVRKYEDIENDVWSIGTLDLTGYNGPINYFLNGFDLLSGDAYLNGSLGYANRLWLQAYSTNVTRRTPLIPLSPPTEPGEVLIPVILSTPFLIDRGEHSAEIRINPTGSEKFALVADVWREHETGDKPLLFRTRVGSADRANRTKFETTLPVDQTTTDLGLGANFTVGTAAFSYRGSTNEYDNHVTGPRLTPDFNPDEPIINSGFNDTKTQNHVLKMNVPLGPKLALTGNYIARDRTHDTAGVVLPDLGSMVVGSDVKSNLRTTNFNLRYVALPNLLLTARYRDFDLNRDSPLIVFNDTIRNQSISRDEKEGEIDATYTGIRSTSVRASYTTRETKRDERAVHEPVGFHPEPELDEWEHPPIAEKTDTKTFRLGATSYLIPSLTLRANWKKSDIDDPAYHGLPTDVDDLTVGATWSRSDDLVLFADFRRLDEKNNDIPAPGFLTIADLAEPDEYTERREAESGAQFSNKVDSIILGLYKSLGTKLTFDANYMIDEIDSKAYWVLGIDANYPPHIGGEGDTTGLPPELVPYNAKNKIWNAGVSYAFKPKWTLRGNFLSGKTEGMTTTDSLFRLVAPVGDKTREWKPIDVNYWRAAIGVSYRWSPRQQLLLELSHNVWNDDIDPTFDGQYTLVTLALSTAF